MLPNQEQAAAAEVNVRSPLGAVAAPRYAYRGEHGHDRGVSACQLVIGYDQGELATTQEGTVDYGTDGQSCLGGLTCSAGSCCDAPVARAGTFEMGAD